MSKFFTDRGHLSTFQPENTPKRSPLKVENNTQILPTEVQNNVGSPENEFFYPQNGQLIGVNLAKSVNFVYFRSTSSKIASLTPTIFRKSFPITAKYKQKMYLKNWILDNLKFSEVNTPTNSTKHPPKKNGRFWMGRRGPFFS